MSQKIEDEEIFENLISKKYEKPFHLIDKPEVCYKFSQLSNKPSKLDKFKKNTEETILSLKKVKKLQTNDNPLREQYAFLKKKMDNIMKDLSESVGNSIVLNEFVEYKQLVLKGFLSHYLKELNRNCSQKATFLLEIWNQVFEVTQFLLALFQRRQNQCEKHHLKENIRMQKDYTSALEGYKAKYDGIKKHTQKLQKMVEYMAQQLRLKKKEVKKIYNDNFNLINTVNDYKHQKAFIELQYIDLMVNTKNLTPQEGKKILKRKQQLYQEQKQIVKLRENRKKILKNMKHEINIEGKTNYKQFMEEINHQLDDNGNTYENIDLDGAIDHALSTKQRMFERNKFQLQNIKNKNKVEGSVGIGVQTKYTDFQMVDGCTQTRFTDKMQCETINHFGTQTQTPIVKKIIKIDGGVQYDKVFQNLCSYKMKRERVYQLSLLGSKGDQKIIFRLSDKYDPMKQKDPNTMEIKYFENQRQSKIFVSKHTQTMDNEDKHDSVPKRREGKIFKRSRFYSKEGEEKKNDNNRKFSLANPVKKKSKIEDKKKLSRFGDKPETVKKKVRGSDFNKNKNEDGKLYRSLSRKGTLSIENGFIANLQKQKTALKEKNKKSQYIQVPNLGRVQLKQLLDNLSISDSESETSSEEFKNQQIERQKMLSSKKQTLKEKISEQVEKKANETPNDSRPETAKSKKNEEEGDPFVGTAIDDGWKEKLMKFSSNPIFQQRRKRESSKIISNHLVRKYIDKSVKYKKVKRNMSLIYKANQNLVGNSIQPFIRDVKKKIRQSTVLTKKLFLPHKMSNVYNILSSAYNKAYELIHRNEPLENFILPLYETLQMVFGTINKPEIYKKMINFVAQLCCQIENKICESFLYFLNLDEKNPACEKVTSYDCFLYLKLLLKLSINGTPLTNLEGVYTTIQKIQEQLSIVLYEQNFSQKMISKIVLSLQNKLETLITTEENKVNIFAICMNIITEIILIKEEVRKSFSEVFQVFSTVTENQKIFVEDIEFLTIPIFRNKIEEVKAIKRIQEISCSQRNRRTISQNEFSSYILKLGILSFEEIYKKSLLKFGITSFEKLQLFRRNTQNCVYQQNEKEYESHLKQYENKVKNEENKVQEETLSRIKDIIGFNMVEKQAALSTERVLGKNLSILYSFSIIYLNKNQEIL